MPVRWMAIRPYIDWAGRRNTANPPVARAFAAYLAEVRPDVVHLHSVQALGADLVPVAKAAGARVVVTMHDFWWVCGRQFLATREPRPCSLVVDAGTCPCEVDHDWLQRRNARLRTALAAADLVLAPSRSAAEVLRANGLGRVEVDDNGLPPWVPVAHQPRQPGTTRLLFTGGPNPLKGWPTLAAALAHLPADGWRLTVCGVQPSADHALPASVAERVTLRPPYAPAELASVLAAHDVLVVPSVMRETQSVVTREALQAGLVVVCTDTLGPEEVVRDGVNGLVVPAADPDALGRALALLVTDPSAVTPDRTVALRSVDDQVAGLEARFERLRRGPAEVTERWRPRRVTILSGIDGASLRYRAELPAEALRLHGVHVDVRHYRDSSVPDLAARADTVVVYRVPATVEVMALLDGLRTRPDPPVVLADIDDLIFDPSLRGSLANIAVLSEAEQDLWWDGVRRYRATIEHADGFVTTTPTLAAAAAELTGLPTWVWANGVGFEMGREADRALRRPRRDGPLRVGYFSGTDTHDHDWAAVERAVVAAVLDHPEAELWLGGHLRPSRALLPLGARVRRLPFLPWRELVGVLRDLDVNLAPLVPDLFNDAKSAIKWSEAALVETPTVASPTEPFRTAIDDGRNGVLADDPDGWYAAVRSLLHDDLLRVRLGTRARRDVLLDLAPYVQGDRYLTILAELHGRRGRRDVPATWREGHPSEPWTSRPLEPYPPLPRLSDDLDHLARTALRAGRSARRAVRPWVERARGRTGR